MYADLSSQPNDQLSCIFKFLDAATLLRCKRVCQRFNTFATRHLPAACDAVDKAYVQACCGYLDIGIPKKIQDYAVTGLTQILLSRSESTDENIKMVADRCGKLLTSFSFAFSNLVSFDTVKYLVQKCPNLNHFGFDNYLLELNNLMFGAKRMSSTMIEYLADHCRLTSFAYTDYLGVILPLEAISKLTQLTRLALQADGTAGMYGDFRGLFNSCTQITELNTKGNAIPHTIKELLHVYCPRLKKINITNGSFYSERAVWGLTQCTYLTDLTICNCYGYFKSYTDIIAQNLPNLAVLNIDWNFTDRQLIMLAERHPYLTELLTLSGTFGNAGIAALADKCPRLTKLHIRSCEHVTPDAARVLLERCTQLTDLAIDRLAEPDENMLVELAARYPNCRMQFIRKG